VNGSCVACKASLQIHDGAASIAVEPSFRTIALVGTASWVFLVVRILPVIWHKKGRPVFPPMLP
jgi:hypothetical protein